jgi:hypothetical protein
MKSESTASNASTPPPLQKIDPATKKLIIDRISKASPDDAIINEVLNLNFEISPEILRKIKSEIEVTQKLEPLKEKYLERLAEACLKKFSANKDDPENFKQQLMDISYAPPAQKPTAESIDKIIAEGNKEGYLNLLRQLEAIDLMNLDTNRKLQVIDQKDLENIANECNLKSYFKITFDENGAPTITPLDRDKIWETGGMNKEEPFVLINPGNGGANKREQLTLSEHFDKSLLYEAKLFEKGHKGTPPTQYLVALNKTAGGENFDVIDAHNKNPNSFKTDYATEQAKTIYGPLIQKDGNALDDQEIINNLAKARNFNCSFGTVTANCQQNALVDYMRELGIQEKTIKAGIEGMRRLDLANVAKVSDNENPRPSTVIFQGANDELAPTQEKASLPADHTNVSLVVAKSNVAIVYQTFPDEVDNPGRKLTKDQKNQEEAIRSGTNTYQERMEKFFGDIKSKLSKLVLGILKKDSQQSLEGDLKEVDLDKARFRDKSRHSPPHATMDATPGNEVEGRDKNLCYALIKDTMERISSKDVVKSTKEVLDESSKKIEAQSVQQGQKKENLKSLSAATKRPQDFYEAQIANAKIANAKRMEVERASPTPSSPRR